MTVLDWLKSWDRSTWVIAVGLVLAVLAVLVLLLGADWTRTAIATVWRQITG